MFPTDSLEGWGMYDGPAGSGSYSPGNAPRGAPAPAVPGESMYDRLKNAVYNPWFQMGLGILGGNSGSTRAEARANAFSGGLRAAQGAAQYRFQSEENARAQADADRKQKQFDLAMESTANMKKFATSMLEKNPSDPFWQAAVVNPDWAIDFMRVNTDAEYKKMAGAADMIRAKASMMNAGSLGGPTAAMRNFEWYNNLSPEKKAAYHKMNGDIAADKRAPSKGYAMVNPSDDVAKTFRSRMRNDPDLAKERRGMAGRRLMDSETYDRAEVMLPLQAYNNMRNGMTEDEAYAAAKAQIFGGGEITPADIAATAEKYGISEEEVVARLKAAGQM